MKSLSCCQDRLPQGTMGEQTMTVKRTQSETQRVYFCSFTCCNWISLFEITDLYGEIYNWLALVTRKGHQICGFVIMPNHLHLLIYVASGKDTINSILSNGKRFLAYEIVKRLEGRGREDVLSLLRARVSVEESLRKKKHRVFEPSSDIKMCETDKFITQKLDYIHANPVKGKWNLAPTAEDYFHSSAAFYNLNSAHPKVVLTHAEEVRSHSASSPTERAGDDA